MAKPVHIKALKYTMDLNEIVDVPINQATVQYVGFDEDYQHAWVRITPLDPAVFSTVLRDLQVHAHDLVPDMTGRPLERVADGRSFCVRLARCGETPLHFGIYDSRDQSSVVWKEEMLDREAIQAILENSPVFDVDVSVAGAFRFEESTCVSVVCRRLYKPATPIEATTMQDHDIDDIVQIDALDAL
jgi:hypothetical protein